MILRISSHHLETVAAHLASFLADLDDGLADGTYEDDAPELREVLAVLNDALKLVPEKPRAWAQNSRWYFRTCVRGEKPNNPEYSEYGMTARTRAECDAIDAKTEKR